eukprot:6197810-Pleurochrysis_carterae.AAC.2
MSTCMHSACKRLIRSACKKAPAASETIGNRALVMLPSGKAAVATSSAVAASDGSAQRGEQRRLFKTSAARTMCHAREDCGDAPRARRASSNARECVKRACIVHHARAAWPRARRWSAYQTQRAPTLCDNRV